MVKIPENTYAEQNKYFNSITFNWAPELPRTSIYWVYVNTHMPSCIHKNVQNIHIFECDCCLKGTICSKFLVRSSFWTLNRNTDCIIVDAANSGPSEQILPGILQYQTRRQQIYLDSQLHRNLQLLELGNFPM